MPSAATEARVLSGLLDQVGEAARLANQPVSLWVPQTAVPTETPLDIVRGIAAKHPWPVAWEERLRAISPISTAHSWLYGAWLNMAGRWVLYDMIPYDLIPESKRVQLGGTPYWEMPKHLRAGRKQACSAFQWEMYRTHQVWACPSWILQGNAGGTPAQYTELEQALMQAKGLEMEPPEAGSLPFAEWDTRVEAQLRSRDRLAQMQMRMAKLRASAGTDLQQAESDLAEEQFRREFWGWWKEQMEPQAEFWAWYSAKEEAQHLPIRQASQAEQAAAEQTEEAYLTTGNLPVVMPWASKD